MRALAWCYDSLKILDKLLSLHRWLEARGVDCLYVTRGRETQAAMLAEGVRAVSLLDLADQRQALLESEPAPDAATIEALTRYERLTGRRVLDLPAASDADYRQALAHFGLAAWGRLLDHWQPQLVLNLNGLPGLAATLTHAAQLRKLDLWFWENGLLPDTLVLDRRGVNYGAHLSGPNWQRIEVPAPGPAERAAVTQLRERIAATGQTLVSHGRRQPGAQWREQRDIPPGRRVVLLPLQVDLDTNVQLYSPVYQSMTQLVAAVRDRLPEGGGVTVVVKEHPKRAPGGDRQVRELVEAAPAGSMIYEYETALPTLLEAADEVVCLNTTVGLEALLRGLPVSVLGQSTYSEKQLTRDLYLEPDPPAALRAVLAQTPPPPDAGTLDRFLAYLLGRHLWPIGDHDPLGARPWWQSQLPAADAQRNPQPPHAAVQVALKRARALAVRVDLALAAGRAHLHGGHDELRSVLGRRWADRFNLRQPEGRGGAALDLSPIPLARLRSGAPPAEAPLTILGVADGAFVPRLRVLLASAARCAPGCEFHAHLINVDAAQAARLKLYHPRCTVTREERRFADDAQRRAYCANRRAALLRDMHRQRARPLLYLDADSIVRKPLDELFDLIAAHDLVAHQRPGEPEHQRVMTGVVGTSATERAGRALDAWAAGIADAQGVWYDDQRELARAIDAVQPHAGQLPLRFIDWTFCLASPIWAGKGVSKDENRLYRIEEQRVLRLASGLPVGLNRALTGWARAVKVFWEIPVIRSLGPWRRDISARLGGDRGPDEGS